MGGKGGEEKAMTAHQPGQWITHILQEDIPLTEVLPHPANPRVHPPSQIRELRASYRRFGQFRSLVGIRPAEMNGKVWCLAGCGTLQAMREEHAEMVTIGLLPPETPSSVIEGILLADNLLAEKATNDEELLVNLLKGQMESEQNLLSVGSSGGGAITSACS
jgi:hypothetical protein